MTQPDPLAAISTFLQQKSIEKQSYVLELEKAEQEKANKEKIKRLKASINLIETEYANYDTYINLVKTSIDRLLKEKLAKFEVAKLTYQEARQDDVAQTEPMDKSAVKKKEKQLIKLKQEFNEAEAKVNAFLVLGTHISKGVHSSSIGSNIIFKRNNALDAYLAGSHLLQYPNLDANSNNTAQDVTHLKRVCSFLSIKADNNQLFQLLAQDPEGFADILMPEQITWLQKSIQQDYNQHITDGRNKQVLWPNSEKAIINNDYICLVPLYPSSLTHALYQYIKQAKQERFQNPREANRRFPQLAITKLGGNNPRNVSQLTNTQAGRNYLMPNLPPKLTHRKEFDISPTGHTFFEKSLRHECQEGWRSLKNAVNAKKSVMAVRDSRKNGIASIIMMVIALAEKIQTEKPAGWSRNHDELEMAQKYWLDPRRGDLLGEEVFKAAYDRGEWIPIIERTLALWLNDWLKQAFPKYALDFDDAEYQEWRRKMNVALRASQRRAGRIHL